MSSGLSAGLGRVLVRLSVDGMTNDEWLKLNVATMRVKSPNGDVTEHPAQVVAAQQRIEATVTFDVEGTWRVGARLGFVGGDWVTSMTTAEIRVSDGFF